MPVLPVLPYLVLMTPCACPPSVAVPCTLTPCACPPSVAVPCTLTPCACPPSVAVPCTYDHLCLSSQCCHTLYLRSPVPVLPVLPCLVLTIPCACPPSVAASSPSWPPAAALVSVAAAVVAVAVDCVALGDRTTNTVQELSHV